MRERLVVSKKFDFVVGKNIINLRSGSCHYCSNYVNSYYLVIYCNYGYSIDYRSYIEHECEMAIKDGMEIIILYNYSNVDKGKCPKRIKDYGKHINMYYYDTDGKCYYWNYSEI